MYRYVVPGWSQTRNHDCFLQVIHITLLQYTLENNFSLIVKQAQAVNCLCKSRNILPQKLLPGKKKNLQFLVFSRIYITFLHDQYINRFLLQLSVAETYRKHSFKHANYFSVSSNYNNEQSFAQHLPKVILFPHFTIMSGCFEHDVHQINDLLLRWMFFYLLASVRTQNVGFWYWQEGQLKT